MKNAKNATFGDTVAFSVRQAVYERGIVDIASLASQLHRADPTRKISDIERMILDLANFFGAPILFDRQDRAALGREDNRGLLIDFVMGDPDALAGK